MMEKAIRGKNEDRRPPFTGQRVSLHTELSYLTLLTCIDLFPPVSTCIDLFPPVSTCFHLFPPVSTCFHLFPPVSTCIDLYRAVSTCFHLFQNPVRTSAFGAMPPAGWRFVIFHPWLKK
jgi:hypothetical protein